MLPKQRRAALLLSLALIPSALAGCNSGGAGTTTSTGGGTATPVTLATPSGGDVVATVGDQKITQSEYFTQLQNYVAQPQQFSQPQPAGRAVMQQLIQSLLLTGLAKQEGVSPTDAEVENQYNNLKMEQEIQRVKPFDQTLADNGLTPDLLKETVLRPQIAQLKLLTKGVNVTDADVKAYYDLHKSTPPLSTPARVHIKRIVLASAADAADISKKIKGGQAFETFVTKSLEKTPPDGEIPQWVPLDTAGNPQLAGLAPVIKTVSTLKAGDTTAPIALNGVYWLVKVVDKRDKQVMTPDQAKSIVQFLILQEKAQKNPTALQAVQQKLHDFQAKTDIQIKLPGVQYTELATELKNPPPIAPPPSLTPGGPGGPQPTAPPTPAAPPAPKAKP